SYISGEVIIHPSAVIAPGVILQAALNSKIIIGSGVCIGMGSILQVHEGTLEVEAGANLGAGFLMVGQGKIGANACIGAATTIFNCSVEPGQVIPSGSILGDESRQVSMSATLTDETKQLEPSATSPTFNRAESESSNQETVQQESKETLATESTPPSASPPPSTSEQQPSHAEESPQEDSATELSTQDAQIGTYIYGQQSIQHLLMTLFPHRKNP
ncbi:MAG: transferase, partial [Scytonema sp. PMC 1069.18]|nr:transferase [Scytonema sp. PMC 1069.18]